LNSSNCEACLLVFVLFLWPYKTVDKDFKQNQTKEDLLEMSQTREYLAIYYYFKSSLRAIFLSEVYLSHSIQCKLSNQNILW